MVYGKRRQADMVLWRRSAAGQCASRNIRSSRVNLYATTGPYHGGTFNPALVQIRKVGALTFDASNLNNATISYTVDGTPVVKTSPG